LCADLPADEFYNFYSFQCIKPLAAVRIETFGVYNVREYVWPGTKDTGDRRKWLQTEWAAHEKNLRELERQHGVFVFGEAYGWYSSQPVVCKLPHMEIVATALPVEREYVDDDVRVRYRGPMNVRISDAQGRVVFDEVLPQGASLSAYDSEGNGPVVEICRSHPTPSVRHPFDGYTKACEVKWHSR
jgi:hypothetical protein